jgi:hypothetical protein
MGGGWSCRDHKHYAQEARFFWFAPYLYHTLKAYAAFNVEYLL